MLHKTRSPLVFMFLSTFAPVPVQGVQTQLAAKSKGAQKAAGALTAVSSLRMKAARRASGAVIRDKKPKAPERV